MYYITKMPDLNVETIRKYSEEFKNMLCINGIKVYNPFVEGHFTNSILNALPDGNRRGLYLIVRERSNIHFGWDLYSYISESDPKTYVKLFDEKLIGVLK